MSTKLKQAAKWTALAAFLAGLFWVATTLPRRQGKASPDEQAARDKLWSQFQED